MKKVKLDLSGKTDLEKIAQAAAHSAAVAQNAAMFTTPNPSAVDFDALVGTAQAAQAAIKTAEDMVKAKRATAQAAMTALQEAYAKRAKYVEGLLPTHPTAIPSAAMQEAAPTTAPIGALPQPQNLRATPGANPGEGKLRCNRVRGAKSYIWECRKHVDGQEWVQIKVSTAANYTVTDLIPGVEYAFRVRAVGAAGDGPWSDEAILRAP